MILTSENIPKVLHDNSYLIVARVGADENTHLGKIHPHETVDYSTTVTYTEVTDLISDLNNMLHTVAAVVHEYPNRREARYVVKYGEVL